MADENIEEEHIKLVEGQLRSLKAARDLITSILVGKGDAVPGALLLAATQSLATAIENERQALDDLSRLKAGERLEIRKPQD